MAKAKPIRKATTKKPKPPEITSISVTSYFKVGDLVLTGKFKSTRGQIVAFGEDKWGNPTVEVEPIPKGRKKNKVIGLFKIWRADIRES